METFKFEDQFDLKEEPKGQIEDTSKKLELIGQMARRCISSNDFQQYKKMFDDELANILNAMVIYTANFGKQGNDNLEIYAVNMIRFVQRITDLRKLITYVELDSKKGTTKEEKDGKI
jgi:hypothetical protein